MPSVPTIDISDDRAAGEIDGACRDVGFFAVVGHGVPAAVTDAAWNSARAFFDLPTETKLRSHFPDSPYGYEPMHSESLASTTGGGGSEADAKQTLNIGPPFRGPDSGFGSHERRWPTEPYELRMTWLSYYSEMEALADRLLSLFARALGADESFFEPLTDRHVSALRALDYPAGGDPAVRAGAHTDYGTLTILKPDPEVGGLQIDDGAGGWIEPEARPGTFIVNVGDLMNLWSNGRWRSTRHRVIPDPAGRRRAALAFFHNPNWDAVVDPIVRPGDAPRFEPVVAGPWIEAKVEAAHG